MVNTKRYRHSIRLQDYNYARCGAYFVTIVTQGRKCLFGNIADCELLLNDAGIMVQGTWNELPNHYPGIKCDAVIIMPNHIHGVIFLAGADSHARPSPTGQPQGVAPTADGAALSLPDVVHRFKTLTTKRYIDGVKQLCWERFAGRLWQRNYFEHVIRNEDSLNRIRQFILDNPVRWEFDRENVLAMQPESADAWRRNGSI